MPHHPPPQSRLSHPRRAARLLSGCIARLPRSLSLPLFALLLTACAGPPPVAQRDWPGAEAALAELADRADRVNGFSAAAGLVIDPPDRGPVSLDGVIIAEEPSHLRIQAFKFDRRAFDLTINPDGVFLWARDQDDRDAPSFDFPADRATGLWLGPLLQPLAPAAATVLEDDPAAGALTVRWPVDAIAAAGADDPGDPAASRPPGAAPGWSLIGVIDRATVTLTQLRVLDPDNRVVQRIRFEAYTPIAGVPWPTRIVARGRLDLELTLSDLELNPDLPAAAFAPPRDARPLTPAPATNE